ncbi:MAG: hypothetical protein EXS35_01165 [Pedosphaera sp.]|nr:hypothetical protein [Pedosphaera sp.]
MKNSSHPRLSFFLLGVVSNFVAFALAFIFINHKLAVRARMHADPQIAGLWGVIEVHQLPLANPDGVLPDQTDRLQKPRWYFENFTELQLVQLLRRCELRPIQKSILLDKRFWTVTSNACILLPPEPVIWSLAPRARGLIYLALANCPSNYSQCFPFRFPPEMFREHLKDSGLQPGDIEKVKRLAYTNAGAVCFTDLNPLHDVLKPAEFENLVAALYNVPAYTLRLVVPPDADLDQLIKYWGRGGREKIVSPLIKGLARVPGGGAINIAQLLPPFPRSRLYTYPEAWDDPNAAREDCFFTSMNFFNETANTSFFARDFTRKTLADEFEVVEGSPTFGDRVLFLDAKGSGIHMCTYVAGDFVFTKNGINRAEPWVLMRMSDVLAIYFGQHPGDGRTVIYRHKDKAALAASTAQLPAE